MKKCGHYIVSGLVQGVWFRKFTQQQAELLQVTGWVRNLPDERVEVLACGDEDNLRIFQARLKEGPKRARVEQVSYEELAWQEHQRFVIQ
jgi:acylphosphatase